MSWDNYFVAQVSAAAALAGLIFVAMTFSLQKMLQIPHLPNRAAEMLILLFALLASGLFGLVPNRSTLQLGIELLQVSR